MLVRLAFRTVRQIIHNDQFILVGLSIGIGVVCALAAIAFRYLLAAVQYVAFGTANEALTTHLNGLSWIHLLLAPTVGGLIVGIMLRTLTDDHKARGVPHVMEACALNGARMPLKTGITSAVISATSLGAGASTGREGPVVHLGASLAAWLAGLLGLSAGLSRTLLGCGVAAAVAASFNAPIAGVFFALEVVVGHYGLRAFAPIVMASVAGTIVSRLHYGDFPAFVLPQSYEIVSFWEFPAFALLGVVCAGVAALFMASVVLAERVGKDLRLPLVLRPAVGGFIVGLIALAYPEVLGVGYEGTDQALRESLDFQLLAALILAKTAATAISIGARFGGGVFSPSLFLGAMTGGAFGIVATELFPTLSSGHGAYTLVGMGAVAAAVLGAPMSTILIVFEMTGDYELTAGLMVAVVIATLITQQTLGHSLFTWQLAERGVALKGGRETNLLSQVKIADVMKQDHRSVPPDAGPDQIRDSLAAARYGEVFVVEPGTAKLVGIITLVDLAQTRDLAGKTAADIARRKPPTRNGTDDIRKAIALMDRAGDSHLPVIDSDENRALIGFVHEHDVLLAYHRALLQARAEERGESDAR